MNFVSENFFQVAANLDASSSEVSSDGLARKVCEGLDAESYQQLSSCLYEG